MCVIAGVHCGCIYYVAFHECFPTFLHFMFLDRHYDSRPTPVDAYFKALIAFVVSPTRAKQLTVHSFRVWLACALLAAGATPEQIMLLLRWSSDAARKLYARAGLGSQAAMLDTAVDMPIDSVRSHTLFAAATAGGRAPRQEEAEAARAVEEARRLVEEAHAVRTPLCSRAELGVEIDYHAQAAAVAAAVPRLIAAVSPPSHPIL